MIGVVILCFNEAERLDLVEVSAAVARHPEWTLLFVDDGSTDATGDVLERIRRLHAPRVTVLGSALNRGKGEAVRSGMLAALEDGADIVAYLDADVSTPFEEFERLICRLEAEEEFDVVLGARVRILGSDVRRNAVRHIVGRVYGTLASLALGVPVYDTQCGAKPFRRTPRLADALSYPFTERWAFDVELLSRLAATPTMPHGHG